MGLSGWIVSWNVMVKMNGFILFGSCGVILNFS